MDHGRENDRTDTDPSSGDVISLHPVDAASRAVGQASTDSVALLSLDRLVRYSNRVPGAFISPLVIGASFEEHVDPASRTTVAECLERVQTTLEPDRYELATPNDFGE